MNALPHFHEIVRARVSAKGTRPPPVMYLLLLSAWVSLGACQPAGPELGERQAQAAPPATDETRTPKDAWTLVPVQGDTASGPRVLVVHDMEGLSGQDDPRTYSFDTEQYPSGQEMLAADVNAVVDGLFAGGATQVLVADGHGSGNPDPDLRADLLDARAVQIIRDQPFDTYFDLPESEQVDAVAVVGMHSKTGSGGFAAHTFTLGIELLINGRTITETELVALSWGRVGVPVIFVSGDDKLRGDLETMPWIEYVTVKEATAADGAVLRPVSEARDDLRDGARRAVEKLAGANSMRAALPVRASLRAVPPASLRILEGVPGVDYADDTCHFVANDMREAYEGLVSLVNLARVGYQSLLYEVIAARPDGEEIIGAFSTALRQRWYDQESGRYERPAPDPPMGEAIRGFHGYR